MKVQDERDYELKLTTEVCIPVKVKKLHSEARLPEYATAEAACFDLFPYLSADLDYIHVPRGASRTIHTGLAFEIPPGWQLKVYSRSGQGFRHSVRLANGTGVIDSDFRGELLIRLRNDSDKPYFVREGIACAQAEIAPVYKAAFEEVDVLSDTERGEGGFGHTDATRPGS